MIEINTLKPNGQEGQFYKLHFQKLGFLLFPKPDLSPLAHFSKSRERQLGKTKVRFNMTSLARYPLFFKDVHYVLMTDFKEILFLPFLCRLLPNVVIIATSLAYQLARISLEAFQERVSEFDTTHQDMNFFRESQILDEYELKMNTSFEDWRELYSKEEVTNTLSCIIKVNYHQIYNTERGVLLRSFPSGKNNGACLWELQAVPTYQKVLLVNEIYQYNWRTCQPFKADKVKESQAQNPYSLVILTRQAFASYSEGEELKIAETIRRINSNAAQGISTTVVLEDETICIDLVPRLTVEPEGRIRQILLGNECLHSMHNYVNSYADYLSEHYKGQLFSETPDYPLIQYHKLRQKGLLIVGSLQQLAVQKKLPLRQIILQSHPFVRFVQDYQHFLETDGTSLIAGQVNHKIEKIRLASNFSKGLLEGLRGSVGKARMVGFGGGTAEIESLQLGKRHVLDGQKPYLYLMANDFRFKRFQYFELVSNEAEVKENQRQFVKLPKNWISQLGVYLSSKGFTLESQDKSRLKTGSSTIELAGDGRIHVGSRSAGELYWIGQGLRSIGSRYDLP